MGPLPYREEAGEILARHVRQWPGQGAAWARSADGASAWAGPRDLRLPWASVSKLIVSLACLLAAEEGTMDLDAPAGPPGCTLAHLLAHASGLPLEGDVPVAPPGRRRIYSNSGMDIAAAHLAQAATMPFEQYVQAGVLMPLGMTTTALAGPPSHGFSGSLADLARLGAELALPTLVSPATWGRATASAWPGLAGVVPGFGRQDPCDWGLGPEIRGHKSPHWTGAGNSPRTFGHFGQSGSFVWFDPGAGVALAGLCSAPFGAWAKGAWPALADDVLACLSS